MTTNDFISKLNRQIEAIIKLDKPLEIAVRSMMAIQSKRIFLNGLNSSESVIGQYVKKPVYISLEGSPESFTPKGKPGGKKDKNLLVSNISTRVTKKIKVKANGSERKTGYFENFLAYKTTIGRNVRIKTYDLFLSGELHRDWANSESFAKPEATKTNQHNYVVNLSEINQKKVDKLGRVFNLSVKERTIFLDLVQKELIKALV